MSLILIMGQVKIKESIEYTFINSSQQLVLLYAYSF